VEAEDEARGWRKTLDRVASAVVVLRVASPRGFDDVKPGTGVATGFVVDADRGLILTNRHVVTPGPVVAEAVFQNNEEVDVRAVYRDPVHDFGIFRYDPDNVRFMDTGELELAPNRARVGTQIRVVGNDAGEKLSILQGTIARLDRAAPSYGQTAFNDFNTFYLQAASGTSGGSSGSPVVDITGRVIGLNAGGKRLAASSFYLPLDRVKRALDLIREGQPVSRGTIQTVLGHQPFDEVRRLGLRPETEASIRSSFPEGIGMIVVREVVPGGPADGKLEVGDVVVRVAEKAVNSFLPIESVLDDGVGETVVFDIERGGKPISVEVGIQDLHSISPDRYLEYSGGVLNPLSYHAARNASVPVGGVYVATSGYALSAAGVPSRSVITEVAGEPTPTLERFEEVVASKPHDARLPVRFYPLSQPRAEKIAVLRNDRRWFSRRKCRRNDVTGNWPCQESPPAPPDSPRTVGETDFDVEGDWALRRIAPSIVMVRSSLPYRLDGVHGNQFHGSGVIFDTERGLVIVDRETVPVALADVTLTFSGSLEVPGELVFLHPEHSLAVVRYDPESIGNTPVREAAFRDVDLEPGDGVSLIALTPTERLVGRKTRISRSEPVRLELTRPPRFREKNLEILTVEDSIQSVGGVLTDRWGRVLAIWSSITASRSRENVAYFGGIAAHHVLRIVEPLSRGEAVDWHSLGLELSPLTLAAARDRGLSDQQARRLERHDPKGRRVLSVRRRAVGMPGDRFFREGDLILSLDGRPVTRHRDLRPISEGGRFRIELLRNGEEITLDVEPERMSGEGTTRAVMWSGALLQAPHPALAWQYNIEPKGVYVSRHWFGSPSTRYRLDATTRIVEVDGMPIDDLDGFLASVAEKKNGDPVRLEIADLDGKPDVLTLKVDLDYWPTYELRKTDRGWVRVSLTGDRAQTQWADSAVDDRGRASDASETSEASDTSEPSGWPDSDQPVQK
jgi:S1-C subfamily serine protease